MTAFNMTYPVGIAEIVCNTSHHNADIMLEYYRDNYISKLYDSLPIWSKDLYLVSFFSSSQGKFAEWIWNNASNGLYGFITYEQLWFSARLRLEY